MKPCLIPRCAFCRFKVEEGDEVIVISERFRFSRKVLIEGIGYVPCSDGCQCSTYERAFGCHSNCLELVPFRLRSAIANSTSYQYEPPQTEEERRVRWLRSSLSTILFITFQGRFPGELCENIAQYCLESFATRHAMALSEKIQQPSSYFISLSTKVWVRYTFFEGARYIRSLTNEQPPDGSAAAELAYDSSSVTTVFVAEDHLGVRDLLFTSSSEKPAI
ncbi:hypothetical protein CHGG_01573 [Chaetomium globosum CBS 148.51]|uniref:Uncharacterized protein n=1 Tax=Chaetomium globosum (strain ATCC 6205 / CBS 148.51 / DSM 1962 / NBRC 6347 / NRRL 1970) TaxID=306901 RepID=Q2HDY1_CHAGB|nr:uncharacterized protein CHGG_01573 [Chaetomium globosum CBS 148.51]EAQ93338.1 hypothetical protein CHGG_01573 [Chaetomium globosum CBS 148.51]